MRNGHFKKILICLLASSAVIVGGGIVAQQTGVFPLSTVVDAATVVTSGNYMYSTLSDGTIKFLGYAPVSYDKNDNEVYHTPKSSVMTIPSSIGGKTVTQIGALKNVDDYMYECTQIKIPATVKSIDDGVFDGWDSVTTLTFLSSNNKTAIKTIGNRAFSGLDIKSVTLPASITSIGVEAFADCYNLSTVTINNTGVVTIGQSAFRDLSSLKTVTIGTGGAKVGVSAFEDCGSLTTVTFKDSTNTVTIGQGAFRGSDVKTVVFSKGTTSIGVEAFADCSNLTKADMTNLTKLTSIGQNAFSGSALASIVIPTGVTQIGGNAFADIYSEDNYGDEREVALTFKNTSAKIKIAQDAFSDTKLGSVTVPQNAYNTTQGTINATTFENAAKLIVLSATQKVTNLDDTGIGSVTTPYGSYIWAGAYKGSIEDDESNKLSYVTLKSGVETVSNYGSSKGNVTYSYVSLTSGKNFTLSCNSSVSKTDKTAKNVVIKVNLAYADFTMNNTSHFKKYFKYSDTQTSTQGTITVSNLTNSSGNANGMLRLTSKVTKTYKIQADSFSKATVSFDTTKDANSKIYNSTYKTYVSTSDSSVVKPTVKVVLGGKTVDPKYYTVSYKNNTGLTGNASVTVTTNTAGAKLYNSGSVTKSFSVKRDISSVNLYTEGTVKQGSTAKGTNLMYSDSAKSAFLPVTGTQYKIGSDKYQLKAKVSGVDKSFKAGSTTFSVSYDPDYAFSEFSGLEMSGVALGEVECTVSATSSNPYFFGSRTVRYLTKYNIGNFSNVKLMDSDDNEYAVSKSKDTAKNDIMYCSSKFTYTGSAYKPTVILAQSSSQGATVDGQYLKYSYANNTNISKDGVKTNLAKVTVSVNTGNCDYLYGTRDIYFKISPKTITSGMFSTPASQTYSGKALTPSVTGLLGSKSLTKGTDFTLSYSNNTNAGTATVKITGKGNLTGSVSKTFKINKASIKNAKIAFVNSSDNTVSYRFGFGVQPSITVTYNGIKLTNNTDYKVIQLGEKSGSTYTGTAPYKVGSQGGVLVVPLSTSKNFISDGSDKLTSYTYGKNKASGLKADFKIAALKLDYMGLSYSPTLTATTADSFANSALPRVTVNGQTLVPYSLTTVQNELKAAFRKKNPKWLPAKLQSEASKQAPSTIKVGNTTKKVKAYYGTFNSDKTKFTIYGVLINTTNKISGNYLNLKDEFYVQNTRASTARVKVCTFCYTTYADDSSKGYKGIELQSTTTASGAVKKIVKPGVHHVYAADIYNSDPNAGIVKDKAWDIKVAPSTPSMTIEDYGTDKEPGRTTITFSPSRSDKFDGNTYYTVRFFKNKNDATKNTNAIKSVVLKYSRNKPSVTTSGLTFVKNNYTFSATGLDYGRSYFVTVQATDSESKISSSIGTPNAFLSSTTMATIDTISYTKSGQNFNVTAKIKQPSNKLSESGGIAHMYYVLTIYTNNGTKLISYNIDKNGTSGYKQIGSDNTTVSLGAVPGMKATEGYYATLDTYLAYNTGIFTDSTYPTKCNYWQVSSNTLAYCPNKSYTLTNSDRFTASVSLDKGVVNSGQTVTVTAKAGSKGVAGFTYKFEVLDPSNKVIETKSYSTPNKSQVWSYKPYTTGNLKIRVTITDKNKVVATGVHGLKVVKTLSNTSSLSSTKIPANGVVTVNLKSSNGETGGIMKYTVKQTSPNGTVTTLLSNSTQQSVTIGDSKNSATGKYKVAVTVTDITGYSVTKTLEYEVTKTFINTSDVLSTDTEIDTGVAVRLNSAGATGKVDYTVQYALYNTSTKTYGSYKTYGTIAGVAANTAKDATVKLPSVGTYKVKITAKGTVNGVSKSDIVERVVTVKYADLVNTSEIDFPIIVEKQGSALVNARSTGGQGTVTYSVKCINVDTEKSTAITKKNSKGYYEVTGLAAGDYIIEVTATDSKKNVAVSELYLNVKKATSWCSAPALTIDGKTYADGDIAAVNSTIKISTTLKSGVTASYEYKAPNSTSTTKMSVDGNGVASLKVSKTGTYSFRVLCTDINGAAISKSWNITVGAIGNLSTVSATTLNKGKELTLTGKAIGGTAPYSYKFEIKHSSDSAYTVLQNFSSTTTRKWIPQKTGTYTVRITAKDNAGKTSAKSMTVTVSSSLSNTSTVSATSVKTGTPVMVQGKASGGTAPYTYSYYYKKSSDTDWVTKQANTSATSVSLSFGTATTYNIKVVVKDSKGVSVEKVFSVVVSSSTLTNSSTLSSTSVTLGDTITLTGKASGGTAPYTYKMEAKHSSSTNYSVLENFTSTTSRKWVPQKTGTYSVRITVKDKAGKTSTKSFTVTVKAKALTNSSTISATSISLGSSVTLTGKASGGTSPYTYKMEAKLTSEQDYTVIKAYGSTASKAWKPEKAGTYTVRISVKDSTGKSVSKTFTITVKSALQNNSTVSATSITKGKELTLTGKASGGTSPYTYKFEAKHSTSTNYSVLEDFSSKTVRKWIPQKTGTYTVRITVKDKDGKTVVKSMTITVK